MAYATVRSRAHMQSSVVVSNDGSATMISVSGSLDALTRGDFERAVCAIERSDERAILDLRDADACDSIAMMAMLRAKKSLGDRLQIFVGSTGGVRRVLEVAGLSRTLGLPQLAVS